MVYHCNKVWLGIRIPTYQVYCILMTIGTVRYTYTSIPIYRYVYQSPDHIFFINILIAVHLFRILDHFWCSLFAICIMLQRGISKQLAFFAHRIAGGNRNMLFAHHHPPLSVSMMQVQRRNFLILYDEYDFLDSDDDRMEGEFK